MLRGILAACVEFGELPETRTSIGPDAPLVAVRKVGRVLADARAEISNLRERLLNGPTEPGDLAERIRAELRGEIDRVQREKAEAISDLITAHREIDRHKAEIVRLDGERNKAVRERDLARHFRVPDPAIEDFIERFQYVSDGQPWETFADDAISNIRQLKQERDEARAEIDRTKAELCRAADALEHARG